MNESNSEVNTTVRERLLNARSLLVAGKYMGDESYKELLKILRVQRSELDYSKSKRKGPGRAKKAKAPAISLDDI